jgi:hypothetical protein
VAAAWADKGLQPFAGQPLARHALQRLAPQVGPLLVNANRHLETYRAWGVEVVVDTEADYPAPWQAFWPACCIAAPLAAGRALRYAPLSRRPGRARPQPKPHRPRWPWRTRRIPSRQHPMRTPPAQRQPSMPHLCVPSPLSA